MLLFVLQILFTRLIGGLDDMLDNERARLTIGEQIIQGLASIESKTYQTTTLRTVAAVNLVSDKIFEEIDQVDNLLDVADKGGDITVLVRLNLDELEVMERTISYRPREVGSAYNLASIELRPKLYRLKQEIGTLKGLLNDHLSILNNPLHPEAHDVAVTTFLKKLTARFRRMNEDAGRLFYRSYTQVEMFRLHQERQREKYVFIEVVLASIIMISIIALALVIAKRIVRDRKKIIHAISEAKAARDEAEHASKVKSDFLSMVSHELRTPLTSILGSLGLLENTTKGQLGKNEAHLFSVAVQNSQRLNALVNDLLDLEKIQSGQLEINQDVIDVPKLVRQAVEANTGYAHKLGVHIELGGAQPPATIIGDKGRLQQVLANLLSNASKFSPEGGYISISWEQLANGLDGGQVVRISVSDEGPGIPLDFRAKLFTPFEQADSSTTRNIGGTGLGLSICKVIVERHHGEITFDTEVGRGTTFFITLPAAEIEAEADA